MFLNKANIKNKLFMQEYFTFLYDICVFFFLHQTPNGYSITQAWGDLLVQYKA